MSRQQHIIHALAVSAMAIAFSVSAQAATNRAFVSTTGNDANTLVNCSPSANCRTFAAAESVLNPNGQILVEDSGGYGAFTIFEPLELTAPSGISANITTTAGNAITVNTTGTVSIQGLQLSGVGTGNDGFFVQSVGSLILSDVDVSGFSNGVHFASSGNLFISASQIHDNTVDGILLDPTSGTVELTVDGSKLHNNGVAIDQEWAGSVTSVDGSTIDNNGLGWSILGFGSLSRSVVRNNGTGVSVGAGGGTGIFKSGWNAYNHNTTGIAVGAGGEAFVFSDFLNFNTNAFTVASGGILMGSNPATTFIDPGQGSTKPSGTVTLD